MSLRFGSHVERVARRLGRQVQLGEMCRSCEGCSLRERCVSTFAHPFRSRQQPLVTSEWTAQGLQA